MDDEDELVLTFARALYENDVAHSPTACPSFETMHEHTRAYYVRLGRAAARTAMMCHGTIEARVMREREASSG